MAKGGARLGAGRPVGARKTGFKIADDIAKEVISRIDAVALWIRLLRSKKDKVALDSFIYLMDRAYGRPVQMIAGDPNKPVNIQLNWQGSPEWMQPQVTINQQIAHVQSAELLAKALALEPEQEPNALIENEES